MALLLSAGFSTVLYQLAVKDLQLYGPGIED